MVFSAQVSYEFVEACWLCEGAACVYVKEKLKGRLCWSFQRYLAVLTQPVREMHFFPGLRASSLWTTQSCCPAAFWTTWGCRTKLKFGSVQVFYNSLPSRVFLTLTGYTGRESRHLSSQLDSPVSLVNSVPFPVLRSLKPKITSPPPTSSLPVRKGVFFHGTWLKTGNKSLSSFLIYLFPTTFLSESLVI